MEQPISDLGRKLKGGLRILGAISGSSDVDALWKLNVIADATFIEQRLTCRHVGL